MSENDAFNVPMGMRNRNSIIDSVLSSMNSNCPTLCNSLDLNTQHQIMVDFPALSLLQGEHMGVHDIGFTMSDHVGLVGRNSITDPSMQDSHPMRDRENEERFISGSGTPISASSLATLLVSRFSTHSNLTELEPPPPVNPSEVLKTSISNNHYDALTSFNCGYDGILGDINNKWAFDKFLACSELVGKYPEKIGFHPFQLVENVTQNEWLSSNSSNMNSDNPCGSSKFDNELSLSLSTCQPSIVHGTIISDQCSEISCSGVDPHSLNRQFGPKTSCNNKNLSLSFGSHRPIQIDQFFSGSRYLRVIQDILAEIANYALENLDPTDYPANVTGTGARNSLSLSCLSGGGYSVLNSDVDAGFCVTQGREVESKKKQLVALLQVVDEQYNQCLDEIHTVISAFHAATELDPHVHARFVLKTVSALYKNLRERISNQILAMGAYSNNGDCREDEKSFETSFIQKQWALQQQLRRKDHQLWRPQRGLPERSVSILRAWMFQNFLHPYPKDAEKHLLAVKSGLTRSQVSNWFINARVRLWKPMIEEMYAEMNRGERGVGTVKNRQQS